MARRSLLLREILFALLDIRLDGITARLPASWEHFPMLVGKLEGLNQSQSSFTERPTGRSFTVICLRMPLSSMIKRPLNEMPSSAFKTP